MLEPMAEPRGCIVDTEYPYRPLPENEVWGADIAAVSEERHRAQAKWLNGSPELVIKVNSPSNSKAELNDKAMTTLNGAGAVEFWIVDAKSHSVTVYARNGVSVYREGETLPVPIFGGRIAIDKLFASV
jgi:Uma2 family endonuclease